MDTEQIKEKYLEIYKDEYEKVSGPYLRKSDNRKFLVIYKISGGKTTTQWCRVIMTILENRKLSEIETVDHRDRDVTNDSPDNLQILERSYHCKKDSKYRKKILAECIWCGCEFEMNQYKISNMKNRDVSGPFCSKSCVGKYGASVQHGKVEKVETYTQYDVEYEYKY